MKKLLILLLLSPAMLFAQNAFNGTWHFNADSAKFSGKPLTVSLLNGTYRCDSCVPMVNTKADGQDHPQTGSPYADSSNVRAVDDHTVEFMAKKNGKVVSQSKNTASGDGNTLTTEWSFVADNGKGGNGKTVYTRIAPAPAGAHPVSGSWQPRKVDSASDSVLTVTFKATDDGLSMSDPLGDSYTAKFDGKDYPYMGDPGTTSVSLKKIDASTIVETDKRKGKVISVSRMTISADGQTMTLDNEDVLRGQKSKFEGKKE